MHRNKSVRAVVSMGTAAFHFQARMLKQKFIGQRT